MNKFSTCRGFTLIEMLVVIVIVGVLITAAVLSMSMISPDRQVKMSASQLFDSIQTAEQQAVLMPQILALKITDKGYVFLRYTQSAKGFAWKPLSHDLLSHAESFAANHIQAKVTQLGNEGSQINLAHEKEKLIIFSDSGDVTPFTIKLSDRTHSVNNQLDMSPEGVLTLKKISGKKP